MRRFEAFRREPEDDGPPPPFRDIIGGGRYERPHWLRRWRFAIAAGIGLIVLFIALIYARGVYADWLWFDSIGYVSVYRQVLVTRLALFFGSSILFLVLLAINLLLALRLVPLRHALLLALVIGLGAGVALDRFLLNMKLSGEDASRLGPGDQIERVSPVQISIEGRAFLGPEDAPVTIVEFTDYQCPYCGLHSRDNLSKLLELYPDQIRYAVLNFPITSIHPGADQAAQAAECAASLGEFWEYHDMLFQNQGSQDNEGLKEMARQVGLDGDSFDLCLDSGAQSQRVLQDFQEGRNYGVRATPTFFINGQMLVGYLPFTDFKSIVDQAAGR